MSDAHETKHSKASEEAMKDNDRHSTGANSAMPEADKGGHSRSEAAHLEGATPHTKAVGDLRTLENKEETTRDNGRATETYRNA